MERKSDDLNEVVTVPDFPGPEIKIPRSELPNILRAEDPRTSTRDKSLPEFLQSKDLPVRSWGKLYEVQMLSYGVVVNTFHSLEPAYCEHYRRNSCQRAWFVGPVALANSHVDDSPWTYALGAWLDQQKDCSVVFVCLGSWCNFSDEQMVEMALGLERSGSPFLWVVRGAGNEEWMPEGWEERVGKRGMVVRGWVPQTTILGHKAVGAFLTHCGWNSILEAATAGVPTLTWPLVFEQFLNERVATEVTGAGEKVFDGFRSTKEEEKVLVTGDEIALKVKGFMEGGRGREAREKARRCKEMAKAAIEVGGSSYNDLNQMIDELIAFTDKKKKKKNNETSASGYHMES